MEVPRIFRKILLMGPVFMDRERIYRKIGTVPSPRMSHTNQAGGPTEYCCNR
jgi:hypothetical protein